MRLPRFAGERKPMEAKSTVTSAQETSCAPVPTHTQKTMRCSAGGRKTSVCTSFQPKSSPSSSLSTAL